MTNIGPDDPVRAAWSRQPAAGGAVDLGRARVKLQKREAEIKKRDRMAYLCATIIAPSWAAAMWFMPDLRVVAAVGFLVAVWVPLVVYSQSGARVTPDADGTCLSFQQALLQRELAFCEAAPRWYLLPIALSQPVLISALFTSPRFPRTAMLFWGAAVMATTAVTVIAFARQRFIRQASELRLELQVLKAAAGGDILAATKGSP
jgi:hypothetical protein